MFFIIKNKFYDRYLIKGHLIEYIWTLIPIILLFFLAIPSLKILYLSDQLINLILIIKAISNQWYWSYEYENFNNSENEFDSFIVKDEIDENNNINSRLLDVDNNLILPYNLETRLLITSIDVIHSFAIPR